MSSIEWINSPDNASYTNILSHAVKIPSHSNIIYCSGQIPHTKDKQLPPGGITEHTYQCILNLSNVLSAAGSSLEKIIKVNIYLKNMDDFAAMNEVYEKLLPNPKPARTCIQAAKLPADVDIEIECVAVA